MELKRKTLMCDELISTSTSSGNSPEPSAVYQVKIGSAMLVVHSASIDEPLEATTDPLWLLINMVGGKSVISSSGGGGTFIEGVGVDKTVEGRWGEWYMSKENEQIDLNYTEHTRVYSKYSALPSNTHIKLSTTCIFRYFGGSMCCVPWTSMPVNMVWSHIEERWF